MNRSAACVCALLVLCTGPGLAATYHVASTGNDGNPGSAAQPWATLQHAADSIAAGDTVYVHAGTYAGGHFTTDGTPSARILLAAWPGEMPVVDTDNPETPDGINLEGASYMTVRGFTVTGVTRAGIRAVLCQDVEILDNVLDQNGRWGVLTGFCDDLLIEGNQASRSAIEHGIYVSNSGDRPVIRGNLVWGNSDNGIHMNGDASIQDPSYPGVSDGIISGALVEQNILHGNGNGGGSAINGDGVQDSLIRNNLIFDQHASGISLYRTDGGAPSHGNRVLNNSVHLASDGRWALNIQDGSTGTQVFNNILHSEHPTRGAIDLCATCLPGTASDNNAFEGVFTLDGGNTTLTLAQWQAQTQLDANSFVATPAALYTAPALDDYTLAPSSPARDAGAARVDVPTDLSGLPRPQGPAWDIGAYEAVDEALVFRDGFES
jgi:parallel beta-helix repeat protein